MEKKRTASSERSTAKPRKRANGSQPAATIKVWEDDPGSGVTADRAVPDLSKLPLALVIAAKAPPPRKYEKNTAQFRYWTAAEALRRAADFWGSRVPAGKWHIGPTLRVLLDEGDDLNAYYDRRALNFFHGDGEDGTVYSGESPDVVCHELGHAVLDAIKPQLWDAASDEAAAFHEAFGDISAVLSALQLSTLRSAVIKETKGHLYRNSRLSRLAEQLGSALRANQPDSVDRDCLRNVVNSFTYTDPLLLQPSGPASQLSSEAHSFSRVFSGATFECIAGMLHAKASKPNQPSADELLAVSGEIADILVDAVKDAPVVPNFYSQVAANMVTRSAKTNQKYPAILKGVFVRRSILSLHSASHIEDLHRSVDIAHKAKAFAAAAPGADLQVIALPANHYALDKSLFVHSASHHRAYLAQAGKESEGVWEPPSSSTAARSFADDLFRRGSVEYIEAKAHAFGQSRRIRSHQVSKAPGGYLLERQAFDCGFGYREPAFGSKNGEDNNKTAGGEAEKKVRRRRHE